MVTETAEENDDQLGVTRFIPLNGVPTKILIYDEKLRELNDGQVRHVETPFNYDRLVLMISGNPGEIEYYRNYLARVHQLTKLPVIGVSNSGHNRPPAWLSMPGVFENPDLYSLDGQLLNKVAFIEQFLTKRTRLVLLAHSIGTYLVLELLAQYPQINSMVEGAVLVMPSLDHMAQTEAGRKVTRLFTYAYYPLIGLSYLLDSLLPAAVQRSLVRYILTTKDTSSLYGTSGGSSTAVNNKSVPDCVIEAATNLLHPHCLRALVHMTRCEFAQVLEPNLAAMEANRSKLTLLYGEADHWAPVAVYRWLKERVSGEVDARLCLGRIDHAFVVDRQGTERIARLTVDILREKLPLLKS
ncbi:hypothetical protein TYRP_022629 [Tyrophagus putrescentiae]|nr:hypothetical protein TYRP_022629 [Tyrophagus putrescentiae]